MNIPARPNALNFLHMQDSRKVTGEDMGNVISYLGKLIGDVERKANDKISVLENRIKELQARVFELEPVITIFDMKCQICGRRFDVEIKQHSELDIGNWGHECACVLCGHKWNEIIDKRPIIK